MRRIFNKSLLFVVVLLSTYNCSKGPRVDMGTMLDIVDAYPDSVLYTLQNLSTINLDDEEFAKYALAYTWALDKLGNDVSNDSLLRHAYIYYNVHDNDKYRARCMYYMGKYYTMVDSIEQAEQSFNLAIKSADRQEDYKTECFSYEKLSRLMARHSPQKAEKYALEAFACYNKLDNKDSVNLVYLLLNVGYCSIQNNHRMQAKIKMEEALQLSSLLNDSTLISSSYQDLSVLYNSCGQQDSSLYAIRKAIAYQSQPDLACRQALVDALLSNNLINEAEEEIEKLTPKSYLGIYSKLYKQHILSIKKKDEAKAVLFADSAYLCLERMYSKEQDAKSKYYQDVLHETQKKADAERLAKNQKYIIFLAVIAIVFLLYVYITNRRHTLFKIKNEEEKNRMQFSHEQELHRKETEYLKTLHEQEISNRDIQIKVLRDFLLKKISIAQKIERIKDTPECRNILQEDDWEQLEVFLNSVDNMFVSRIKERFPLLTDKDIQLFMLLRLQIPANRIASIYCISEKAVKQKLYLYKEKVGLVGEKMSLRAFIETF